MSKIVALIVLSLLAVSCTCSREVTQARENKGTSLQSHMNEQTIVYKTTTDLSNYVPVIMDAGRTKIVSYPSPVDLCIDGKLAKPVALKNGYWLDKRGITENVAFLNYTYEEYSKLAEAPDDMLTKIKDKYPLKELIYCGSRYRFKDEVKELNDLIDAGFPGCSKAGIIPMGVFFQK